MLLNPPKLIRPIHFHLKCRIVTSILAFSQKRRDESQFVANNIMQQILSIELNLHALNINTYFNVAGK